MKRIMTTFLALFIVLSCCISAYSINIDGYDGGNEWYDCEMESILSGESNCKVNFGLMKWRIDNKTNALYICALFQEKEEFDNSLNSGVTIIIEDSDPFIVTSNSSPCFYDVDRYSFEGAVNIDKNSGGTCEIRIGLKYGIPSQINGKIRFIDSDGIPSNYYDFSISNNVYSEPIAEAKYESITETSTKIQKENSNKTTARESKNSSIDIGWISDLIFDEKEETKVQKTTSADKKKTTTTQKTKKSKYNAEYVKNDINNNQITENIIQSNSTTQSQSDNITDAAQIAALSTTQGKKYKTFTAIAGGFAIIAVAVLGSLGTIKSKNKVDDKDKSNTDN